MAFVMLSSCGNGGSSKNEKLIDSIRQTIGSNEYTLIYVGAHWCGPCTMVFENNMSKIIDAEIENLECVTIFFDSGKVRNNENIMKYSPVILSSLGGFVDKNKANDILDKVLKDYEKVNYMPIMRLCDKQGNIISDKQLTVEMLKKIIGN